jgi:hypothetical protein
VSHRATLDMVTERKFPAPPRWSSSPYSVTIMTELSQVVTILLTQSFLYFKLFQTQYTGKSAEDTPTR